MIATMVTPGLWPSRSFSMFCFGSKNTARAAQTLARWSRIFLTAGIIPCTVHVPSEHCALHLSLANVMKNETACHVIVMSNRKVRTECTNQKKPLRRNALSHEKNPRIVELETCDGASATKRRSKGRGSEVAMNVSGRSHAYVLAVKATSGPRNCSAVNASVLVAHMVLYQLQ